MYEWRLCSKTMKVVPSRKSIETDPSEDSRFGIGSMRMRPASSARRISRSERIMYGPRCLTALSRGAAPAILDRNGAAPWLAQPQLKPADCVPEESVGAYKLLRRYGVAAPRQERIPREYFKMVGPERDAKIWALKRQLGENLVILGHHYQRDEVIQFADFRGDSFKLSQQAAGRGDAEYILFCGVHFMAESADILSQPHQKVILPNLEAGCSMADMAKSDDVQ